MDTFLRRRSKVTFGPNQGNTVENEEPEIFAPPEVGIIIRESMAMGQEQLTVTLRQCPFPRQNPLRQHLPGSQL